MTQPFPDQSFKGGVRRFPELVMLKEAGKDLTPASSEGVETSLAARKFWHEDWTGDSFMAIGMQDPVLGPKAMHILKSIIKDCPETDGSRRRRSFRAGMGRANRQGSARKNLGSVDEVSPSLFFPKRDHSPGGVFHDRHLAAHKAARRRHYVPHPRFMVSSRLFSRFSTTT